MQNIDGLHLLEEVITICPPRVIALMKDLMSSICPDMTQTRYFSLGPTRWWLKNSHRCKKLYSILRGGKHLTHYALHDISIRVTNLPIFSKTSNCRGAIFVEFRCEMRVLTPFSFSLAESEMICRHYSRNAWSRKSDDANVGGILVSVII